MKHRGTYPPNWREIARQVKANVGHRCERCGHPDEPPWKTAQGRFIPMWQSRTGSRQDVRSPCDERCSHPPNSKQRMLTVHHLDNDKGNCERWNLAALCQVCHLVIQGRVKLEQFWMLPHSPWMLPHVEGYYASLEGDAYLLALS